MNSVSIHVNYKLSWQELTLARSKKKRPVVGGLERFLRLIEKKVCDFGFMDFAEKNSVVKEKLCDQFCQRISKICQKIMEQ